MPRTVCRSGTCLHRDSCMRNGKGRRTVRGIGRGAATTRSRSGAKRYNTGNRAGCFRVNCNLDPLELEYWRDFRTRGTPHKGLHYARCHSQPQTRQTPDTSQTQDKHNQDTSNLRHIIKPLTKNIGLSTTPQIKMPFLWFDYVFCVFLNFVC